jgi:long-subunit acyl-CoA synthetase (AMP-forming)
VRVVAREQPVTLMLESGDEFTLLDKPHARGEILVESNHVARAYYRAQADTEEVFKDWAYFSGDIGRAIVKRKRMDHIEVIERKAHCRKLANKEKVLVTRCQVR